jgi:hypothetical protein
LIVLAGLVPWTFAHGTGSVGIYAFAAKPVRRGYPGQGLSSAARSADPSDTFSEFLREQLAPLGRVTKRRMFDKTGVFCDGLMFGM